VEATEDDTVVLFYSGHGPPDHRITGFDTDLTNLVAKSLPMAEIAELFKKSKAKNILCILDCCFSGGAPAKVLETAPIPRDMGNPLDSLAGKGYDSRPASQSKKIASEQSQKSDSSWFAQELECQRERRGSIL